MTTPTRRSVLRTAAWTVPAITVAGAAPAFAASTPLPDLSASTLNPIAPVRNGNQVTISPVLIRNSGDLKTGSLTFTYATTGTITAAHILVPFTPVATAFGAAGMTTAPTPALPAGTFSSTFLAFSDIAPGAAMSDVASIRLTFADDSPVDITISATSGNGGTAWTSETITVA